jgi:acetolactate synthase I/II/III large subunit
MKKLESQNDAVERRAFLKTATAGAAALVAQASIPSSAPAQAAAKPAPAAVDELGLPEAQYTERPGSDFMVDVLKTLNFEYLCSNPGSSFRSLQESLVNYGGNKAPEFLTCCHEESSVAMCQGYFKVEGKPLAAMAHGTVGLQHASMSLYNAWCDRVPLYLILGNTLNATERAPGVEWYHSVQDPVAMVREYTKWDDQPVSLQHFAESAIRAYKISMTPPFEPVVLVADTELQEKPVEELTDHIGGEKGLKIPKLTLTSPPSGETGAVNEVAKLLVAAENPVIVADRYARTENGMKYLIELAETLQAAVVDLAGRMNFPNRHPLNQPGSIVGSADVILGLEVSSLWGAVNTMDDRLHRSSEPRIKPGAKLISITAMDLFTRSNYQDFQRHQDVHLAIAADAEATMPALLEAVKRLITADRKNFFADRGVKLARASQQAQERLRQNAAYGWDASPITTARLAAEVWNQIKTKDWALVSRFDSLNRWAFQLWNFDKKYRHIGTTGGAGIGYNSGAAVGAALAHRKHGRLAVNLQNDGDLLYAPGVLWTAAHHRIPMLTIMNNNRAYHQETMYLQQMANRHNRSLTTANIGCSIDDPNVDFTKIAQGMGWHAEGPITDPKDLAPAIARAIKVVEAGQPALVDTWMQPR